MASIQEIAHIAQSQYGLLTRQQLLDAGTSASQIRTLMKNGHLIKKGYGIYKIFGAPENWIYKAYLATLVCGEQSYLSHESVLMLHKLLDDNGSDRYRKRRPDDRKHLIHVIARRPEFHTSEIFYHRSTYLDTLDRSTETYGIRHVTIERALIDCCQQLSRFEIDVAIDRALSQKKISIPRMHFLLGRLHSAPGREKKKIRTIFEPYITLDTSTGVESSLEKKVETTLNQVAQGLVRQHNINIKGKKYRLDFALPDHKIAIEVDGFAFHRSRMQFDNDRRRQNDLISRGWKILRVTADFTEDEIINAYLNLKTNT
jgi:very-short-patch-repair endonuclease